MYVPNLLVLGELTSVLVNLKEQRACASARPWVRLPSSGKKKGKKKKKNNNKRDKLDWEIFEETVW